MRINLETGRMPAPIPVATESVPGIKSGKNSEGSEFADSMRLAFHKVEAAAQDADRAAEDLIQGRVDIHEAMVTMEKADLMLQLGTTVRNKLLDAYHKLMSAGN
ncbi:MAG: flagellar hook-basal body complex protein FliE [Nannocystaceae bacterium]